MNAKILHNNTYVIMVKDCEQIKQDQINNWAEKYFTKWLTSKEKNKQIGREEWKKKILNLKYMVCILRKYSTKKSENKYSMHETKNTVSPVSAENTTPQILKKKKKIKSKRSCVNNASYAAKEQTNQ